VRQLLGAELRYSTAADLCDTIDSDTAVLYLSHVDFRSARMHDMAALTQRAHHWGAIVLWNLAHSAAAVPLELSRWNVDLAVGCGYKYLNGGPGAPSFVFVSRRHHAGLQQPLCGWFSHSNPFEFSAQYRPSDGVRRVLCGTPPILSFTALEASLDMFLDVDMNAVRQKSITMSDLFVQLVRQECGGTELKLRSPHDAQQRGSHVALAHPHSYSVMQALIDRQVIGDFRAPNLMRFGFAPLYLSFVDVWEAVQTLSEILRDRVWQQPEYQQRESVT
jgi:kynureninase